MKIYRQGREAKHKVSIAFGASILRAERFAQTLVGNRRAII
jgi:hypothetical protein